MAHLYDTATNTKQIIICLEQRRRSGKIQLIVNNFATIEPTSYMAEKMYVFCLQCVMIFHTTRRTVRIACRFDPNLCVVREEKK